MMYDHKRHSWNGDNHTKTVTECLHCGLERRAVLVHEKDEPPGTPGKGATQYKIDGRWRNQRAPSCIVTDLKTTGTALDIATLDAWVFIHPGCSYKVLDKKTILALPNGFSKQFAGPTLDSARHSAAQHIERITKKKAETCEQKS